MRPWFARTAAPLRNRGLVPLRGAAQRAPLVALSVCVLCSRCHRTAARTALDLARSRPRYKAGSQVFERGRRDDALRERGDACHQMLPSLRVKFRERVVEQQHGWVAVLVGEQRDLSEEECEEQAALLAT